MGNENKKVVNGFTFFAVAIAAVGGLLFGYDTGVISGAILFIQKQFALSSTMEEIVVSSVLVGAVIGAAFGGAFTNRFGRRKMIIIAGIIFTLSALASSLAPDMSILIAARIASGIGIGIASFISPMYIAELVPARVRGALVAVNMLAITTGIVVAYLVDYAFSGTGAWRYMFSLAAIPSLILTIGMWRLPASPRWLVSKSKVDLARKILLEVRTTKNVEPELKEIRDSVELQRGSGIADLFHKSVKMPLVIGLGLATFQQITGINTVIYYSPTIFKYVGITTPGQAILAGAGLTMIMWFMHIGAIFLLDRVGRRPLLLVGLIGQIIGLAILGMAFKFFPLGSLKSILAIGGLVIYVSCFAFGLGPVFWLLISEIYPLEVRSIAMSVVTVTNWATNLLVAVSFLTLIGIFGDANTFWLYGVIAVFCLIFIYKLVPETKGKTLEQIEAHWIAGKHPRAM